MPATEVWFRNPERYMPLVVEAGGTRIAWHRGRLQRRRVDPIAHAKLCWPEGAEWRVLVVDVRGALEYGPSSTRFERPLACYPVWHYGEPLETLEELLEANVAEVNCAPFDEDPLFTPRRGQEHRVLVSGWPELNTNVGRRFMTTLADMQREYPKAILHLFEANGYRAAFSYGFAAVDLDPVAYARYKRVSLANGLAPRLERLPEMPQWVHLHGYTIDQLHESVDTRIAFNIRSALWAGENYASKLRFRTGSDARRMPDVDIPIFEAPETKSYKSHPNLSSVLGDKVTCDTCSLVNTCKYARFGSVCTLPESETAGLARFFKSRDTDTIIDGLSAILQVQAQRAEMGMAGESDLGELNSETSAVLKAMFEGGVKLAKLINPALSPSGPKIAVQINQGNGAGQVSAANPKALMAALVRELEERGVPRGEITPEMVMSLVQPRGEIVEVNEAS